MFIALLRSINQYTYYIKCTRSANKMKGKKVRRTLKIETRKFVDQEAISFNFNECDGNTVELNSYQCPWERNFYFYTTGPNQDQILISTTMDCTNQLTFIFALELKNLKEEYVFKFMGIKDLITDREGADYSAERLERRLMVREKPEQPMDLITCPQIPTYFNPIVTKQSPQIWFVPRYMHPIELEEGMILRFHCLQNGKQEIEDATIQSLRVNYVIEQVGPESISNNSDLSKQNQMNLLHICEQREQKGKNKEKDKKGQQLLCVYCHDGTEDKIMAKNPHLLVDPCLCKGGLKYVHMKCLATWLEIKKSENLKCPTCGRPFPQFLEVSRITKNGDKVVKYFHLIGHNDVPFVVINGYNIPLYSHETLLLGSKGNCNFKILSEEKLVHASIKYNRKQEKAFIEDSKTKYGTLLRKKKMVIKLKKYLQPATCTIMVGKTMYYFTIEESGN